MRFAAAENVTVVFPEQIPPWVYSDGADGIAVEIVERALAYRGHTLTVEVVPFSRMNKAIEKQHVDAVAMVEGKKIKGRYYYSNVTTKFTTSLISLSRNNFKIASWNDLRDKRIVAFLDAKKVFPQVADLARGNNGYKEIGNQQSQVTLLFKGRADLILIDRSIFYYWRNSLSQVNTRLSLTFHDLAAISDIDVDSPTQTVFKNEHLLRQFNQGLDQLKNSGEYQQIINKHIRSELTIERARN